MGCPYHQKQDTTKKVSTSIPSVKETFGVWKMTKDFFSSNSPSSIFIKEGWLRETKSTEKSGRESFPFHAFNPLTPGENGAKVSYSTKGLIDLSPSTD